MSFPRHIAPVLVIVLGLVAAHGAAAELNPVDLSPAGSSASAPRIASDGQGNIVAIWRELDGDDSAIRTASRSAGEDWGAGRRISAPAAATEAPQLAMDRLGNAAAIWHRSNGQDSVVQAAIRPSGGSWSAPADLSPPGGQAFNADVAVEAGRVTAVWAEMDEWRSVVRTASRPVAGPWSAAETISEPTSNAYAPVVAMDNGGGAVTAWQWWDGAYLVIQAAVRGPDGLWSPPETLSGPGRDASRPQLGVDGAGDAVAAWLRSNGTWIAAQVASRPVGGRWSPPRNLSQRGGNASELDLAVNRRGDAAVAWVQDGLLTSSRPANAERWGPPARMGEYWDGRRGRIALDEAGNATAVWAGFGRISASFKPAGQAWQDDYLLSGYDFSSAHPAVAAHNERHATAIWVRVDEDDDRIEAVAYDIDTAEREAAGDEEEFDSGEEEGEVFSGSAGPDRLVGTPGDDVFYGFGGDDVIDGRGGQDAVYGGAGHDRLAGGTGRDRLIGGAGSDTIRGGTGSDVLVGGPDEDLLLGGAGNDAFRALDLRRDRVFGGVGLDAYRLDRWLDRARSIETRL